METIKKRINIYTVGTDAFVLLWSLLVLVTVTILCILIPNPGSTLLTAFLWLISLFGSLIVFLFLLIYMFGSWIVVRTIARKNSFFVVQKMITKKDSYLLTQNVSHEKRVYGSLCFLNELSIGIKEGLRTLKPGTYYMVTHDKMIARFKRFRPDNVELFEDGDAGSSKLCLEKYFIKKRCKECVKDCPLRKDLKEPVPMKYVRIVVS